ncbi:hypothetical protein D3C76_1662550 [compost metagenome]
MNIYALIMNKHLYIGNASTGFYFHYISFFMDFSAYENTKDALIRASFAKFGQFAANSLYSQRLFTFYSNFILLSAGHEVSKGKRQEY